VPDNAILQALPSAERSRLLDRGREVALGQYELLQAAGAPVSRVLFVRSGAVSLFSEPSEGRSIETGVVGREGIVGGVSVLEGALNGSARSQFAGTAWSVDAAAFRDALRTSPMLAKLTQRHLHFLLLQAQQNAVCHAWHTVEERFCRRLLQSCDALNSEVVNLTQGFTAQILGVQRTTVSMVANALERDGGIRTLRGKITLVDRAKIESAACTCYTAFKRQLKSALELAA